MVNVCKMSSSLLKSYWSGAKSKELYCVEWTISISKCPDDDHRWSVKLVGLNKKQFMEQLGT